MPIADAHITQYPGFPLAGGNHSIAFTTFLLDAAGEKAAFIFQVPKSGTISHVHLRSNTVTTAGDADIRLETVDTTTGDPTGTLAGTNSNATLNIATGTTWYRVALTAGLAVTRGDLLALVVANTTGNYTITMFDGTTSGRSYPYTDFFTASWVKFSNTMVAIIEYNDVTYPYLPGAFPVKTLTNIAISTTTTPDEIGNKFVAPGPLRVIGCGIYGNVSQAFELHLYDSGNTSIASVTTAADPQVRSAVGAGMHEYYFNTDVTLTAGATYRIVLKPTSTTSLTVQVLDLDQAGYMSAMPGGTNWQYTSRVDAGAFSETSTRRLPIWLLVDGISDGAGGVRVHPGMSGGINA